MKKYDPEAFRQRIKQATMHLIAAGGMSNFSYPKLTSITGIVAPTVYELYKNKEDLLTSCFLEIDAGIGQLLADAVKKKPPHREQVEDVENCCWLLWVTYWRYLMSYAHRTLFYWAFYNSEYYTDAVIKHRSKNYLAFAQYIDEFDKRFHISEQYNHHVLIMHLIDWTLYAAIKVIRGEFENDNVTINTIYHAVFQPVFLILN